MALGRQSTLRAPPLTLGPPPPSKLQAGYLGEGVQHGEGQRVVQVDPLAQRQCPPQDLQSHLTRQSALEEQRRLGDGPSRATAAALSKWAQRERERFGGFGYLGPFMLRALDRIPLALHVCTFLDN
jgi:hypothetical protein